MKFKQGIRQMAAGFALALSLSASHGGTTFDPLKQPFGVLPPIALTGFNISTGDKVLFQPWFDPQSWVGDLTALRIDATGHTDLANKLWSASETIAAQNWDTGRRIVTRDPVAGTSIPFRWTGGLGAAQQTALGSEAILNYVRGDRSNEKQLTQDDGNGGQTVINTGSSTSGTLRGRRWVLGDMLHGRAAFVGAPPADYIFDSYQSFKTSNLSRAGRVYAGANDGMLHAFNSATGEEVFAFIPSVLVSKLRRLSDDPYEHQYFVDGPLTVGDANFGNSGTPDWRTVLVGGLGAGGKSYFALDVTNPAAADENAAKGKILWEVSSSTAGFTDLGYSYGDISIGRVSCPVTLINNPCTRWVAIFPNGYLSANGKAILYVVDVATGELIRALDTGTGSTSSPNGLSSPTAVDTTLDGIIDVVYAGDMDGNVWKFDLRNTNPASWSLSRLHSAEDSDSVTAGVQGRPIIGPVDVAAHPTTGYLVYFATGRLYTQTEAQDATIANHIYAVWDGATNGSTTFLTQTLSNGTYNNAFDIRSGTGKQPNWTSSNRCDDVPLPEVLASCVDVAVPHKGWKVSLPAGEHGVSGGFVRDGRYHVISVNTSQQNQSRPNGANWLMELNYLTGGAPTNMVFDLNGDSLLDDGDRATDSSGDAIDGPTGVPLGIYLGPGMFSTPSLVLLSASLSTTLYNNNPYVSPGNIPDDPVIEEEGGRGVAGGHFDVDIFYANPKICDYTPTTTTAAIDAVYQIQVNSTGNLYQANVGAITLGTTQIANAFTVTNGSATTANAAALRDAINAKGTQFTATSAGNTVSIATPPGSAAAGNGLAFNIVPGTFTAATGGTAATGKIVIGAQPGGGATRITAVAFNSTSILPSTIGFAAGSSIASIASALNAVLSTPAGFTKSIATTNVANDTILFTQTAVGGAAPTISVTATSGSTPSVRPTALIQFGGGPTGGSAEIQRTLDGGVNTIKVATTVVYSSRISLGNNRNASQVAAAVVSAVGAGGTMAAVQGGTAVTPICGAQPNTTVCLIDTGSFTNGKAVTMGATVNFNSMSATLVASAGGIASVAAVGQPVTITRTAGTPAVGNDNLAAVMVTSQPVRGQNASTTGGELTGCDTRKHTHEYDDKYDVTGVNMLAASDPDYNLSIPIPDATTQFKVIVHNQYLSPAVTLDIGNSGRVSVKDISTSPTLNSGVATDPVDLPVHTRADIGTLMFDMPRDAFKVKDWWGNGDERVGLHPTMPGCMWSSASALDGSLYQPVIPPANGVDGPGTNSNTAGARHNGSLVVQIIRASTPNSALEMNIDGRPEYGWRVRAADFENYVLAEYGVFWHHPNGACYGTASWTKQAPQDPTSCLTDELIAGSTLSNAQARCYVAPATGSADPGLGTARASAVSTSTTTTTTGTGLDTVRTTVTVITYSDGSTMTLTSIQRARRLNSDGSVRSWFAGTVTTTYTGAIGGTGSGSGGGGGAANQGSNVTNTITGYQQSRNAGKLGRVSWRELIRQ